MAMANSRNLKFFPLKIEPHRYHPLIQVGPKIRDDGGAPIFSTIRIPKKGHPDEWPKSGSRQERIKMSPETRSPDYRRHLGPKPYG
jgi:hypothetical protein